MGWDPPWGDFSVPKTAETKLTPKDVGAASKQLKLVNKFLGTLEKLGADIPTPLTKSLSALSKALSAGAAVGEAATEASDELEKYNKNLEAACKNIDDAQQKICEAGKISSYQYRNVNFTLDPKNKNSVISKLIDKAIKAYTPKLICKEVTAQPGDRMVCPRNVALIA